MNRPPAHRSSPPSLGSICRIPSHADLALRGVLSSRSGTPRRPLLTPPTSHRRRARAAFVGHTVLHLPSPEQKPRQGPAPHGTMLRCCLCLGELGKAGCAFLWLYVVVLLYFVSVTSYDISYERKGRQFTTNRRTTRLGATQDGTTRRCAAMLR